METSGRHPKATVAVLGGDRQRWSRLVTALESEGVQVVFYPALEPLLEHLRERRVDFVIFHSPTADAVRHAVLASIRRSGPDVPVLLVADEANIAAAVEAIRHGASDFLEAPSHRSLVRHVREAIDLSGTSAAKPTARLSRRRRPGPHRRGAGGRLPLSGAARRRFDLDSVGRPGEALRLDSDGWIRIDDPAAARRLAHGVAARWSAGRPGPPTAGEIFALALVCRAMEQMLRRHLAAVRPGALQSALRRFELDLSPQSVQSVLRHFVDIFPPREVGTGRIAGEAWLTGSDGGVPRSESALVNLLLVRALNRNPAAEPARELFDDDALVDGVAKQVAGPYPQMAQGLAQFLASEAGGDVSALALVHPLDPQRDQGAFLGRQLDQWLRAIGPAEELGRQMRVAQGVLAEEHRPPATGLPGPPPPPSDYHDLEGEVERFATARPWMNELVLLAKNLRVWLAQLRERHRRPIRRLDEIPDGELSALADLGVNGLWLVGLWEASVASRRIKIAMGDLEAGASAYAIPRYRIAADLGGMEALESLRKRAWRYGIRLAADVVPNHTSIDSDWLLEHPEWFLSLPESPFPRYRFSGPDLSPDPRVGLYLEDGYRDRSDAAVVFQRVDRATGDVRYVYHGNDGTGLPWNDTAQIDHLNPEARRAVLDTIVDAALAFPILRIDSAMAITRRHVHRLWHPEPGAGGAIPSRAEHGLGRVEFHERMPRELWVEATEAVARTAPETLLLAEAFWLMERYFVRSLGVHRVYNSAFLHHLAAGNVAGLRRDLAAALDDDPRIVERLANYLTNPDEAPASASFGCSGRYLAAATLLATLPGLPLFGHGQIEGAGEHYGMEQERPRHREPPGAEMLEAHRGRIAPLLARRSLFAGTKAFRLWDCRTASGEPCDDVIAYSNGTGEEAALVVVHFRDAEVRGRIVDRDPAPGATARGDDLLAQLVGPLDAGSEVHFREWRPTEGGQGLCSRELALVPAELGRHGVAVDLGPWDVRLFEVVRQRRGPVTGVAAEEVGRSPHPAPSRPPGRLQPAPGAPGETTREPRARRAAPPFV